MENKSGYSHLTSTATAIGLITLIFFILHLGKSLFLPLIIALVIWYIIFELSNLCAKIRIGHHRLPQSLALGLGIILAALILYAFTWLLSSSITGIIKEAPDYQQKVQQLLAHFNHITHNTLNPTQLIEGLDFKRIFSTLALTLSSIIGNLALILVYLLFLSLEAKTFTHKIRAISKSKAQFNQIEKILQRIHTDTNTFLKTKTLLNALAGFSSYILMKLYGITYAEFWATLIFLLHYIPFIGPVIAVIFVLLVASVQLHLLSAFVTFAIILAVIQFLVGNVLEAKLMGNRLNLSPLVVLLSLVFWGYIWGVLGMFLCIPMMMIITIVCANFKSTKPLAIALSATGKIRQP